MIYLICWYSILFVAGYLIYNNQGCAFLNIEMPIPFEYTFYFLCLFLLPVALLATLLGLAQASMDVHDHKQSPPRYESFRKYETNQLNKGEFLADIKNSINELKPPF